MWLLQLRKSGQLRTSEETSYCELAFAWRNTTVFSIRVPIDLCVSMRLLDPRSASYVLHGLSCGFDKTFQEKCLSLPVVYATEAHRANSIVVNGSSVCFGMAFKDAPWL